MARVVLVSGIGGFTGRYLADLLAAQGFKVVGIDSKTSTKHPFEVHACNLLDREGLVDIVGRIQPDYVAHLAAISFVAHEDVDAIYRVNVVGTRNLLQALAQVKTPPKSVILASSANIYGNAEVDPINELVQPHPANDYAVSKLAMEHMARLWMDKLPICIVRPFNYTGVGQSVNFLLPKIVDHFKRGMRTIELGNIQVARDFSDVRDVVNAYAKLLAGGVKGEIFNVCSGRAYTLAEVLMIAADIAGYALQVQVNPHFVRANEVKTLRGSAAKLEAVLGPTDRHSLSDTLRWMLEA